MEIKSTKDAKESNKGDKDKEKDKEKEKEPLVEDNTWKPWGHIWPKEKTKGSPLPVYNPGGKYCVRIFWMVSSCDTIFAFNTGYRIYSPISRSRL